MSETVNALALALHKGPPRMACCPSCETPLISTMAFPGAEFYCLECGNHVGYVMPLGKEETPEILAAYEALKAEWDEHIAGKLIAPGSWRIGCPSCESGTREQHSLHATEAERLADGEAREWLTARVRS